MVVVWCVVEGLEGLGRDSLEEGLGRDSLERTLSVENSLENSLCRELSGELSLERSSPERSSPEDTPEDTPHTHPLSSNPRPHDPKRGIPTLLTRGKREEEKGGLHTQILKISLGENPQTPLNYPRTDLRSGEKTRRGGARVSRAIRQNR